LAVPDPTPASTEQQRLPLIDYARHPDYGGMFEPDEALGRQAMSVLEPLIEDQRKLEAERRDTFGYRFTGDGPVGRQLADDGLVRFQVADRLMAPVCAASAPLLEEITERLDAMKAAGETVLFKDQAQQIDPEGHGELWAALHDALHDVDAFVLTTRFFGSKKSKLQSAQVLVSRPRPKDGESVAATEGLHIDSSGRCILKAVLYLDDVGPDQGPFGLVPGSHQWEAGDVSRVYRRAFDRSGLVGRGGKKRRQFMSLPREMQVKAEFGGDLLPGEPQARELLARESVSVGPRGMLSLFDPEAIHRGGQAREGERHAILLTLRTRYR
jgi:hypothetical protein